MPRQEVCSPRVGIVGRHLLSSRRRHQPLSHPNPPGIRNASSGRLRRRWYLGRAELLASQISRTHRSSPNARRG